MLMKRKRDLVYWSLNKHHAGNVIEESIKKIHVCKEGEIHVRSLKYRVVVSARELRFKPTAVSYDKCFPLILSIHSVPLITVR